MNRELLICLLTISSVVWAQDCVPTNHRAGPSVTSPDGRHQVLDVLCSNQGEGRSMAFVLLNIKSGERRNLYVYTRAAYATWSPDSRWIAINDYAGSDYTNNVVVSIDRDVTPIDLKKRLLQSKPKQDILRSDHLYLSTKGWKSESEIRLLAWGHDSGQKTGFCRCFLMSLAGPIQQCRLPSGAADPEEYCEKVKK